MESSHKCIANEFFNPLVTSTILLFALNNWWLKYQFHNWFTGKLSDLLFCFFFPLYCSAILAFITQWKIRSRVIFGILFTLVLFILMKTSMFFSTQISNIFSYLTKITVGISSINIVDPTDLIVVPIVFYSFNLALKQNVNQ